MSEPLSRRLFLRRAATAAPVALVGTGAAIGPAFGSDENPELLALEVPFREAEAAAVRAAKHKREARERMLAMLPAVPPELIARTRLIGGAVYNQSAERTDNDGTAILDERGCRVRVYRSYHLRRDLEGMDGRTTTAKRLKALLKLAEPFEAEEKRVFAASGFDQACWDLYHAERSLSEVADQIRDTEARSLVGLTLKARAISAVHSMGDRYKFYVTSSGPLLAAAILAVAGATPSEPIQPPFDYEGAIARIEAMGVTLTAVVRKGKCEGFRQPPVTAAQGDAICNILEYRRGFCPIQMGKVLAVQGKAGPAAESRGRIMNRPLPSNFGGFIPELAAAPPPILVGFDPNDLPEIYTIRGTEGRCMEPYIMDGAKLLFSSTEPVEPGDIVIIYQTPESVRPGEYQALVKRLVSYDPGAQGRETGVIARMHNPPMRLVYPACIVMAVHKCLGVRPADLPTYRVEQQDVARMAAERRAKGVRP